MYSRAKRMIAMIMAIATLFTFALSAQAIEAEEMQATQAVYDALPDDTIVCYILGVPVYKYEVDENGYVHKDFTAVLASSARATGLQTGVLTGNELAETIGAGMNHVYTGYSESNSILYLHNAEAKAMASSFTQGLSTNHAVAQALGSYGTGIAATAPVFAICAGICGSVLILDAVTREGIAAEIRETAGSSGHVMLVKAVSQYGTFYTSTSWDGRTVYKPSSYTASGVTITVNGVYCAHGSVW